MKNTEGVKMELKFNPANENDLAKVLNLFKIAAESLQKRGINQWQHWQNPAEEYVNWVKNGLAKDEYFFVEKEGQIAGMFRLMYADTDYWGETDVAAGYVHSLITLPEFAGQNMGSQTLQLIENQLIEKQISFFRLDCKADNQPLCNYYKKHGFEPVRLQQMPHYAVQLFEKKLF